MSIWWSYIGEGISINTMLIYIHTRLITPFKWTGGREEGLGGKYILFFVFNDLKRGLFYFHPRSFCLPLAK